ncbi:coiled-coil domain-containing protein 34 isoform X2 [Apteryx rowi]|uniref:coiled-coil domain-containing protein 34 isoform X2 n=1 Tax=Apteryx rowi TaxID=308060 RepID=UPI000E1D03D9|nr:coiled-coil domain-containing protein 34 isoform X2 [Apteryx rowi]
MNSGARARGRRRAARPSPPSPASSEGEEPLSSSSCSQLSPVSRHSSRSCEEEEEEEGDVASQSQKGNRKAEDSEIIGGRNRSPLKDNLSPWEEWFICKEKELRARLQVRALEEINLQLEKMKEKQESERRRRIAEEKHKEWVQKKREEEKEKEREAELQEKKERSEKIFKEWLHNARNKARPVLNGYGYPHGKSTGYHDGISYPAPAYCNPIPWKPIHVPPPKEDSIVTMKNSKRPVYSQSHRSAPMVIYKPPNNLCVGSLCRKQL